MGKRASVSILLGILGNLIKYKVGIGRSKNEPLDPRYKMDKIHATSLEGNSLDSPVERDLRVYLPPGYDDHPSTDYPVIYLLHGYGGNNHNWTITSSGEVQDGSGLLVSLFPRSIKKRVDMERIVLFYEQFDALILQGTIDPFILVQPDASLYIPTKNGGKGLNGHPMTKGSFYVNSPHCGNYMDYIMNDVIPHVEMYYRTRAEKSKRALLGLSMGGYGAMYLGLHHPDSFAAIAALSPGNVTRDMIEWEMFVPLEELIFGTRYAERSGEKTFADVIDTIDMVYSKDAPLLVGDASENVLREKAISNWDAHDLSQLIELHPVAFEKTRLFLSCNENDEYGLFPAARRIHETLQSVGIEHDCVLENDPAAYLSPHLLGVAYHILDGIEHCLKYVG